MTEQRPNDEEVLALASVFPTATVDDWRAQLTKVLERSGRRIADPATPEKAIRTIVDGEIELDPLYTPDTSTELPLPGFEPFTRGSTALGSVENGWDVRQLHCDPDAIKTNKLILDDLENGVSSLWLLVGTGAIAVSDLPLALEGVMLDLITISISSWDDTVSAVQKIVEIAQERGIDATNLKINAGLDPLHLAAAYGLEASSDGLAGQVATIRELAPNSIPVTVDSSVYFDAGSTHVQELAYSIATGLAYLRELVAGGSSVDEALESIEFRYAIDDDQFTGIAKLRAARQMWGQVAKSSNAGPRIRGQRQHAATAVSMYTKYDPWVNMLRGTIACFAAATGGADAVTVFPFDSRAGLPDSFARRVARNTQSVLAEESNIGRVVDPAGGSSYVESLTSELASRAWALVQQLEREGGIVAALNSGSIATAIEQVRARREERIAKRKEPITGVSEFPNLGEVLPERDDVDVSFLSDRQPGVNALGLRFKSEAFETFRDLSEATLASTGSRPSVFIATLGPVAAHTARENFATNLLAAGGIDTIKGPIGADVAEVAAAFTAAGTPVACVAASDTLYSESGDELIKALRDAGATSIVLAGKADKIDGLDEVVDTELFMGCDAAAAIQRTFDQLGVQSG